METRFDKMTIRIEIPRGYINLAVTTCNHLVGDTNNSDAWDWFKFPLPQGHWSILSINDKMVTLQNMDLEFEK